LSNHTIIINNNQYKDFLKAYKANINRLKLVTSLNGIISSGISQPQVEDKAIEDEMNI